ncbi:MAG: hypothetical protein A2428_04610 [Bdellovibrionales bacterium RIFOXYC1_FULL_54_43]|nr:MAG: hypothetical protein A2428_04610 [Bdellovibrionales bacterium RIFOXYC1_FULL_54_43]OFZ78846.1 MAG: hypothetical protein A2603_08480 [Bdellovibrionales bacterium RIFOXYD1_FULL_55_31]
MSVEWVAVLAKTGFVITMLLSVAPVMNWVERRGAGFIQIRRGPNRVGPFGLLQTVADAVKFLFKEDRVPAHVSPFYYFIAPIVVLVPACMTFAVIPFAGPITIAGQVIPMQAADLNVGFLYIFAIASLGVYGLIMGGWASNNSFSILGSMRSSSQMISYEISLALSVVGLVMIHSTVELGQMVKLQSEALLSFGPIVIPRWGIFVQPIGFLVFLTAVFAETNRLPFDLPEGEPEIVGYHVEYGAMKFATFMMAEYMNMAVASGLAVTLFFGGYQLLPGMGTVLGALHLQGSTQDWIRVLFEIISFTVKIAFFMWFFVWVRWTLPRFRYDQLMDLGWRVMFPLSLANICVTAALVYKGWV